MKLKHFDLFDVTYLAVAYICETIVPYLESPSMLAAQDREWICPFPEQHWVAQPKENSHTM